MQDGPGFRLVQGSIRDGGLVDDLAHGTDWIFHLAAAVGSFVIRDRTLESLRTNIHGTENVIEAAHRHGRASCWSPRPARSTARTTRSGSREDDDRVIGSPLQVAVELRRGEGDRREPGRRVRRGSAACAAVIVRLFNTVGPAADRPVRDGHPALRPAGAGRRAADRVRHRRAGALLLPRARRGSGPDRAHCRGRRLRAGGELRQQRAGVDRRSWPSGSSRRPESSEHDQERSYLEAYGAGVRGHAAPGAGLRARPRS